MAGSDGRNGPRITGREAVLVLDAVAVQDTEPGTVVVLNENEVTRARSLMVTVHQLGIPEALAAAKPAGSRPRRLTAAGMAPADPDTGHGLSPLVRSRLDRVVHEAPHVLAGAAGGGRPSLRRARRRRRREVRPHAWADTSAPQSPVS
ncbi:hydrogenase maturation protease [Streptomyces sp. NPDC102365]|uniref:hydrogenase maturation protease n=1 Tax=Streptomyces sp. NPDC102365 TaxID=3366162 RepID=UPI0037F45803